MALIGCPVNVGQFGTTDKDLDRYKQAGEYALEAKMYRDDSLTIYNELKSDDIQEKIARAEDAANRAETAEIHVADMTATVEADFNIIDGWVKDMSVTPYGFTAVGGETTITLPSNFTKVSSIYINGGRQEAGDDFTYNATTHVVTFSSALQQGDRVSVLAGTVYEQTSTLAQTLKGLGGADYIITGSGKSVQEELDSQPFELSYYNNSDSPLLSLLEYGSSSGEECVINRDITLTVPVFFNANGRILKLRFDHTIFSDTQLLTLTNLGKGSYLKHPDFKNIKPPFVINRWDTKGEWTSPSIIQTNEEVGYQPTGSDSDIWSTLDISVQNQKICSGVIITYSTGVDVISMTGRHSAITFNDCNHCRVINPNFMGGKHQYGSILFNNTGTPSWGEGNCVIGGTVRYGSVSCVVFMRNKGYSGGVFGGFVPFRCGESGVKTYQNNVNGRSARNYRLTIDSVFPYQCYYDGVDTFSDYGTQEERVDDYLLSQYGWGKLPTEHKVSNISSKDCHSTGVTGDGQFNSYTNIEIDESFSSGFFNSGSNNTVKNIIVKNGNKNNAALGAQIRMLGVCSISDVTIITESTKVNAGNSLYTTGVGTSLNNINLDGTNLPSIPAKPAKQNLFLGKISSTDSTCTIEANPRPTILPNASGRINFNLTLGSIGSEQGEVDIQGVYGGAFVKGMRARGDAGGFLIGGLANTFNSTILRVGEFCLYEKAGVLHVAAKLSDGTVVDKSL